MTSSSRETWLILLIAFILSVLFISFFLKILKGILLLVVLALVLPVMYLIVRSFFPKKKKIDPPRKIDNLN